MTMSRKDYTLIASTLNVVRRAALADGKPDAVAGIDMAADVLALRLEADNPRFDQARFRDSVRAER